MRIIIPIIAFSFFFLSSPSQSPVILQKYIDAGTNGPATDYPEFFIQTADSGFVVLEGNTDNSSYQINLIKLDRNGNVLWRKGYPYNSNTTLYPESMMETRSSCLVICGWVYTQQTKGKEYFVLKTDKNGNVIFLNIYAPPNYWVIAANRSLLPGGHPVNTTSGVKIKETRLGEFVLASLITYSPPIPNYNVPIYYHIFKTDSTGLPLWTKIYNPISQTIGKEFSDLEVSRLITGMESYTVCGMVNDSAQNYQRNINMLSVDESGNIRWSYDYYLCPKNCVLSLKSTNDLGFVLTGVADDMQQPAGLGTGILLAKVDSLGSPLWAYSYSESNFASCYGMHVTVTPDQSNLITGRLINSTNATPPPSDLDALMLKTTFTGGLVWAVSYGTQNNTEHGMQGYMNKAFDGYTLAGGGRSLYSDDIYLVKTDLNGNSVCDQSFLSMEVDSLSFTFTPNGSSMGLPLICMVTSTGGTNLIINEIVLCQGLGVPEPGHLTEINLGPNPATEELLIQLSEHLGPFVLEMYDALGKKILSRQVTALEKEIKLNLLSFSRGVYFMRLSGNGILQTFRIIRQ